MKREPTEDQLPSPEEIRQICQEIQGRWSEGECRRRTMLRPTPWAVPALDIPVDSDAATA